MSIHPLNAAFLLLVPSWVPQELPSEKKQPAWRDSVSYQLPKNKEAKTRATRSAEWLKRHLVSVHRGGAERPLRVIAWKDPTLEPGEPTRLAGYVITDSLWAAKALKAFDPATSAEIEGGIQRLGWYGNGLHDVLFHPLDVIKHRPDDEDYVHGFSLGRHPISEGRTVDLRVFREKFDARFSVGHPRLFAEHAVYEALFDFWQGRQEAARRRILGVVKDERATDPRDRLFWDGETGILVDDVTYKDWLAFHQGERPVCVHYTFKLGVLLYAIRLLGMEDEKEIAPRLGGMKKRLWSAQTESGGVAHFVNVRSLEKATPGLQPTGEASAIAILSEVVEREPR